MRDVACFERLSYRQAWQVIVDNMNRLSYPDRFKLDKKFHLE